MLADKVLRNSLLLSVIIHAIVIFNGRPFFKNFSNPPIPKELEVTYYKKISHLLPEAIVSPKEKIAGSNLPDKRKVSLERRIKPESKINKLFSPSTEKVQPVKAVLKQDKMIISYNSKDLSSNPYYLKYHSIVRAKIEKMANANKPYIFRIGEVNLIFTILNSGDLKSADLVEKSSAPDPILRQCALDSVYAASPFPPFTGSMKEDHLTLHVTISFEK